MEQPDNKVTLTRMSYPTIDSMKKIAVTSNKETKSLCKMSRNCCYYSPAIGSIGSLSIADDGVLFELEAGVKCRERPPRAHLAICLLVRPPGASDSNRPPLTLCSICKCSWKSSETRLGSPPGNAAHIGHICL